MMEMTFREALNLCLKEEMERDEAVFLLGEDIGLYGGAFGVTAGLIQQFGAGRVMETPIIESSLMGIATGCALMGHRPILEIMFMDFTTLIIDQLLNHTVKLKYMFGGTDEIKVPLVIRTPFGGGRAYGASHSQSLESLFIHIPGLKIAAPSNPASARKLLKAAIRDDNPVMFLEHKLLYSKKGDVSIEDGDPGFLGKAEVIMQGSDITFISYARMLDLCIEAAQDLENEGYSVEVIDLCSLAPLDKETLCASVEKTGRVVIVEEGTLTGGIGAEIVSILMENVFFSLESPPSRVASPDIPIPYSPQLESKVIPDKQRILQAAFETLEY